MRRRVWGVFALFLAGLAAGCSRPAVPAPAPSQAAGSTLVTLTSGTQMHTGDNTLTVLLADARTGAPVGDANVTATAQMLSPRLPGASIAGRAQGNGVYNIPVRLGIASRYDIELKIERPGKPVAEAVFPVEAAE